jgi:hypothetical protein
MVGGFIVLIKDIPQHRDFRTISNLKNNKSLTQKLSISSLQISNLNFSWFELNFKTNESKRQRFELA